MHMLDQIKLMANYNRHMNRKILDVAAELPAGVIALNKGAFFGSILGTLNHILVGDLLWLHRFQKHAAHFTVLDALAGFPVPVSLDQMLYYKLDAFSSKRQQLDDVIIEWTSQITQHDLDKALQYRRVNGDINHRSFAGLLMHFFNHQTHHRGQVTTLLSQEGLDVGVTDLLAMIPEEAA